MASADVVQTIISLVTDTLTYMLPVIAVLAGINFVITWIMSITFGFGRRTFKG
jgi:type III secretory pathway component EscS